MSSWPSGVSPQLTATRRKAVRPTAQAAVVREAEDHCVLAARPTATATRTARSSTAVRGRCCTTSTATARCCRRAPTTVWCAGADTASSTGAAAPRTGRRSVSRPLSAGPAPHGSRYSQDARQQVRVWGNTVREDAHAWADAGRQAARSGPFRSRRLPAAPSPVPSSRPNPVQPTARTGSPAGRPGPAPARPTAPTSPAGDDATPPGTPTSPNRLMRRQRHASGEPWIDQDGPGLSRRREFPHHTA